MLSFIQSIVLTVLLAFLIRFFVIQPFVVEGESMEPNFHNAQYIIIDKLSYKLHPPQRGDVVVLHPPIQLDQNYIKRIVGLPGETISFKNGDVFINGQKLDENYLGDENHKTDEVNTHLPVKLGTQDYFVLGDNREHSSDSREWGILKKDEIEGRTWFVILPFADFHFIQRPSYATNVSFNFHLKSV